MQKQQAESAPAEAVEASSAAAELPAGVEIITMPRLSDTMEEGTVASWLKVGDTVEGDILAEIETDKATMEFEAFMEERFYILESKKASRRKLTVCWPLLEIKTPM